MPWHSEQVIDIYVPVTVDGQQKYLHGQYRIPAPLNSWRGQVCRLVTKLGDFVSANRRRSWLLDGLYSKTRFGWIAWVELRNILLYGKPFKGESIQHRVVDCRPWQHRGTRVSRDYLYKF